MSVEQNGAGHTMLAKSAPVATTRYAAADLIALGQTLLSAAGMPAEKAEDVAEIVTEGELMGKFTHGFSLLPRYVHEIETGGMNVTGGPEVLHDFGATLAWDGRKLPGPWLVLRAMDEAMARAKKFGMGAVTIQRSHHLASLGAYLKRATDAGYLMLLTLTDAGHSGVAPYGGITPVLTSNPIAFGAPTARGPMLMDTTTSLQSNGMVALYKQRGAQLPRPDLMDNTGRPTTNPGVISTTPPGSILPLGGMNDGHKGSAISLMVEFLTGCLSGRGRDEPFEGWSAASFLLILDPAFFGGTDMYLKQANRLADLVHASLPRPGFDRVRLPGENGLERRQKALRDGVPLPQTLIEELAELARKYGVSMPRWL
jgi:LDH2 family malate/lactate/ureidoglycolate dehydrogenase